MFLRGFGLFTADYLLIAGLVACQGLLICDTLTYRMNAMDDFALASTSVPVKKVRDEPTEKPTNSTYQGINRD